MCNSEKERTNAMAKSTKNNPQNTTQKTNRGELKCSERTTLSCPTSGTDCVT